MEKYYGVSLIVYCSMLFGIFVLGVGSQLLWGPDNAITDVVDDYFEEEFDLDMFDD